ncbi:unnamed protein product [Nesidiocoris tenuis]|uniref:Reverse transcriptase domain-containing protein n=1 Tax=Nesidiocoris tenuis TaxID=355587 RepID=A0A6H5G014_9HEMI|nr:unnamed protein product [Nesidiocoris tenuis]
MFGWVIVGSLPSPSNAVVTPALSLCITEQSLHDSVQKFWASEEVTIERPINPIDEKVEAQFVETHTREPSGRYQVRLPFCSNPLLPPFGDSRLIAERRWLNVERKLRCNESLRSAYHAFMREFIDLGHMSPATTPGTFVIPHFAIQRDSSTSPVRVVFDGSCRDTSGLSLNDRLLTGPSLQKDIAEIVTLFRLAPVAVTCDIEKMFRNVKVDPRDRHVQRVLYRERETDPLVQYEINTLVYGLSSSPFLAQRTLQQLVADEGAEFPLASKAILECCFMDDIAYALSDLQTAKRYKDEMVSLMRRGGFELRKWASNSIELLQDIPAGHQSKLLTLTNESNPSLHILGVVWHPTADHFSYRIAVGPVANTKRSILSQVASIYDPIGWITLHGGAQVTQATLQSKFWILSARSLVRKRIHRCLTCYRETVKPTHPQMADLPPARVTQDRVFADTGVDFAGPFLVKENTSRRAREVKAYMCIFVCTRVKAVHIELVGSLSTASYQAALERFVARRGLCRNIFCDQGRNFVGAAREMEEIRAFLQQTEEDVGTFLSTRNVEYRFNPPLVALDGRTVGSSCEIC